MGEFYPVNSNGVPAIASESPPSSPSADEDYARRMFIAFWLSGAMLVDGEFVVRPEAGEFFLPRDKALSVISDFMETTKAKGSIGTGNITRRQTHASLPGILSPLAPIRRRALRVQDSTRLRKQIHQTYLSNGSLQSSGCQSSSDARHDDERSV